MKRARTVAVLLSAVLLSQAALAEPTPGSPSAADRATARTLAQEGQEALEGKKYSAAADRFSRADSLVHAPTLLLGLARAQLALGKLVESQENYNRIIREGVAPGAPRSWAKALTDATKEVEGLAARIPWVTITVSGPQNPDVMLDATTVPSASLGVRRAVNPGEHTIRASADGFLPASKTIAIVEAQTLSVTLILERAPAPATPLPVAETPAPLPLPAKTGGARKTIGWVAIGVGGAGLAAGAITGVLAMQKRRQLIDDFHCSGTQGICPPAAEPTLNRFHTLTTVSTIGIITAGVGLVGGTILLLTLPRSSSTQTANSAQVSAFVGWGSAGVEGTW